MKKNKIYCPSCLSELYVTHRDRVQDLSEHVSNPNGIPSLKDIYECTNFERCLESIYGSFWIEDGDYFLSRPSHRTPEYSELEDRVLKGRKMGTHHAINSWNYYYELGKKETKRLTKNIIVGKWRLEIKPKEYGYKYPENKWHMPNKWRWWFNLYVASEITEFGRSESLFHSWPRQIKFQVGRFRENYVSAIGGSKYALRECLATIKRNQYRKDVVADTVTSLIISTFYYRKKSKIPEISKNEKL